MTRPLNGDELAEAEGSAFAAWRATAVELAAVLYGHSLSGLDELLLAGFQAGDTPAECLAGVFAEA
jgi:hypothetical protein